MSKLIYLASPYTHPDPAVREQRYMAAVQATMKLLQSGMAVFCPVAYSHQFALQGMGGEWDTWERFDRVMIERCDELWILEIPGWEESKGIKAELNLAREMGKVVRFLE